MDVKQTAIGLWWCERELLNLLAIIHRDGGDYTGKFGVMKSTEDAKIIVANLIHQERR
jgi:hypothetical protein